MLLRSAFAHVPLAAIGTAGAVVVVDNDGLGAAALRLA